MRQLRGEAINAGIYPPNDVGVTGGWINLLWERRLKPNSSEIVTEMRTIHVTWKRAEQAQNNLASLADIV